MAFGMPDYLALFLSVVVGVILLLVFYVRHCYGYWERKKVPFLKPTFPLGNIKTLLPRGISMGIISMAFYDEFKKRNCKAGGVYIGLNPSIIVLDPSYIKNILITDFDHFVDRGIYMTEKVPITVSIFAQNGIDWKNTRMKFTSMFTSAKMKMIFETVRNCATEAATFLETAARDKTDVDILEVMACYTTDVVGSVVYGLECNSFKHPDAEFRRMGRQLFGEFSLRDQINLFMTIYYPKLAQRLGISNIQNHITDFFMNSIRNTIEYREKNDIRRQDFLQMLIDMKNSKVLLSVDELVSQSFLFFSAGFEQSASTLTFALYEMGYRQDIQDKLRKEILEVLQRHNNEVTYTALAEMKYLSQVIDETLRLWPPVSTVTRVCVKDYKIPDSNIIIEKGFKVLIPTMSLHCDQDYWPEPLKWDPDRFSEDVKHDPSKPYMPFGVGPRNCLGLRFGSMQIKVGLVTILKSYRVFVSPKTITPIELDPDTFLLHTKHKIFLKMEKL